MKRKLTFLSFILLLGTPIVLTVIDINKKNNVLESYREIVNDNYSELNIEDGEIDIINNLKTEYNNDDIVGTIKIEGTDIDTMIVQGEDNEYYLNHSYDKSSDQMGAIFLDYRNKLNDKKLIMYGHNFRYKDGGFHQLTKFENKEFYDEHKYIDIDINNKKERFEVFSIMVEKSEVYLHTMLNFKNEDRYLEHIKWLKENSIYETNVDVNKDDYIITLQTCYYSPVGSYFIINAKKI